jgi:kumamolisin
MSTKSWTPPKRAHYLGHHTGEAPLSATLVLRRRTEHPNAESLPLPDVSAIGAAVEHGTFGATWGAHEEDLANIFQFASDHGLTVTESDAARRVVKVSGAPAAMRAAFDVDFHCYQCVASGRTFTTTSHAPRLPEGVKAVLGLDRRPVAHTYLKPHAPDALDQGGFTPLQIGQFYNFPPGTDGSGQCIAIIELGGGYTQENLDAYFRSLDVPSPQVLAVSVAGGQNVTGSDADGEVQLDIEVAGALAPGAKYVVYFTTNTDEGFHEAISQAAHDQIHKPSIISISWGGPEDEWGPQAVASIQAALEDAASLGITILVAAGDNGASDGVNDGRLHCDFPASSPSVLACGGTRVIANGNHLAQESVWNENVNNEGATGGGVSTIFPLPTWQQAVNVPKNPNGFAGRGVPDVAGDADPVSGYQVLVNGQAQVVGGTSAVAPLWAALVARFNQALGEPVGFFNPILYAIPSVESNFRDIIAGGNDGYSSRSGWDATTGFGSPNGVALLKVLQAMKTSGEKV